MQKHYQGSSILSTNDREIKIDYFLISSIKSFEEKTHPQVTYGIEIMENGDNSEMIEDVDLNKEKVLEIIEVMRKNDVMAVHLHDVIENLL